MTSPLPTTVLDLLTVMGRMPGKEWIGIPNSTNYTGTILSIATNGV